MKNEIRLIDANLLTTNIAQIAKRCAKSDAQKALIGRILFMIENMPTERVIGEAMEETKLSPCPFCGGTAKIIICDDEGNIRDEEYKERFHEAALEVLHSIANEAEFMGQYDNADRALRVFVNAIVLGTLEHRLFGGKENE